MLPRYLALILLLLFPVASRAQHVYLRLGGGYQVSAPIGDELQLDGYPFSGIPSAEPGRYIDYRKGASLAAGTWANLAAGYRLSEQFALELSLDHSLSLRGYTQETRLPNQSGLRTNVDLRASTMRLLGLSAAWAPIDLQRGLYIRLGLAVPLTLNIESLSSTRNDSMMILDRRRYETKSGLAVRAGVGYNLALSERISISGELSFLGFAPKMTRAVLTSSTINGENQLSGKPERERIVEYRDDFPAGFSTDPDLPGQMPTYRVPLSNIGLQLSLLLSL